MMKEILDRNKALIKGIAKEDLPIGDHIENEE